MRKQLINIISTTENTVALDLFNIFSTRLRHQYASSFI